MVYRYFLCAILSMVCLTGVAQKYGEPSMPYGKQQQQPSSWQGTGWAINNGYVVTNYHIVDGARSLKLKHVIGDSVRQFTGEVTVTDIEHDLAIIKITDSKFRGFGRLPYALKTQPAEVGESVFVLGYPMTDILGDEIKLTTGVLSSRTGYQGDATSYQVSAPIQPGNSGGPLFDNNGNVIACINAKVPAAENVGYAIKAQYVSELIAKLSAASEIQPTNEDLAGKTLPEKVKAVKSYIFTIYASTQALDIPRSAQPQYGAPPVSKGSHTIEMPYVDNALSMNAIRIQRLTLSETQTVIEFQYSNRTAQGYYQWINIDKNTYINVSGKKYRLLSADGIAIAPNQTLLNGVTDNKLFRLVFPAIPQGTTSFDMIEPGDSDWKFYGISTKE